MIRKRIKIFSNRDSYTKQKGVTELKREKPMNIFPELAKLMNCKRMFQNDVAKLLGQSQQGISLKLKGKSEFRRDEMVTLRDYFRDIDPELTMDKLFEIYLHT
jgi:hypothetical protein